MSDTRQNRLSLLETAKVVIDALLAEGYTQDDAAAQRELQDLSVGLQSLTRRLAGDIAHDALETQAMEEPIDPTGIAEGEIPEVPQ